MEMTGAAESQVLLSFYRALGAVQDVAKTEEADTGRYKYSYAPLGSVLDEVKRACQMFELAITQEPTQYEGQFSIVTSLIHADGGVLEFEPTVMKMPNDAQALGSAMSYLRRYSLLSIFGIAPEDDDGKAATQAERDAQNAREGNRSQAEKRIRAHIGALDADEKAMIQNEFRAAFGMGLADLPVNRHGDALGWVLKWKPTPPQGTEGDDITDQVGV
jgi:hypothetical protein